MGYNYRYIKHKKRKIPKRATKGGLEGGYCEGGGMGVC